MAKHLNVNLDFNANTSKAQSQIQSLVSELNKLSSGVGLAKDLPITQEILEAQNAAKQLGVALEQATNVDTGKLDLTSFNQQLKNSGMTLQQYSSQLTMLGSAGDKAFLQVAQSIVNTEAPLRRSNALLQEFATTLANTARWQISSMILHGFISALQSAHGYAQDLNESLNNIRIVTSANTDEMARFAKEANKAAKALSTTTTEYTNASLIYFQQGLSEEEVKKRADITIKMANVSRQSAEEVSEQLTAVWNNFYDGTKALDYYADVMTALGAATASSSEEIADGLNKFAAVAETVGLSYEYAAAALATVTATTRQSADVVGTAFKTLFARLNDLKLGETLDDGTTLGTYTENLAKVGVQIKDANGDLKSMDNILSETAEKWKNLDKDQQVALAKGVAGLRQYTQFIALMDNWDFMEENLATANNSVGELSNQADIYAESWEASSARVKASLETIYESLIDDEFFINLNNTIAKIIDTFGLFIDSVGGVKGVLLLLGSVLTKVFGTQMAASINNAVQNFRVFSGLAAEEAAKVKKEAYDMAMAMTKDMDNMETAALRDALTSSYEAQERVAQSARHMSEEQKLAAEQAIKVAQSFNEQAIAAGQAADAALKVREAERSQSSGTWGQGAVNKMDAFNDQAIGQRGEQLIATSKKMISVANTLGVSTREASKALKTYETTLNNPKASKNDLTKASNALLHQLNEVRGNVPGAVQKFQNFQDRVDSCAETVVAAASDFNTLKDAVYTGSANTDGLADNIKSVAASAQAANLPIGDLETAIKNYDLAMSTATTEEQKTAALKQLQAAFTTTKISTEDMDKAIAQSAGGAQAVSEAYLQEAASARVAATAVNTTTKATAEAERQANILAAKLEANTLKYQSFGTAITGTLQGLSSFAMGLNSIKSAFDTLKDPDIGTFEKFTSLLMSLGMGVPMLISSFSALGGAIQFVTSSQEKGLVAQLATLVNAKKEIALNGYMVVAKGGEVVVRGLTKEAAEAEALAKGGVVAATNIDTAATWANIAAKMISYWYIGLIIVALGALAAIIYKVVKAYNAEADAAKEAAETAEHLKEAYDEAKEAAQELQDTIDKYRSSRNAMDGLIRGTREYKEALLAANEEALALLEQHEFLAKYMSRGNDGLIVISDAGLDALLDEQLKNLELLQADYIAAELTASNLQERSDRLNFSRAEDLPLELTNALIDSIVAFFEKTDSDSLIPEDLLNMDAYRNATEEQQAQILNNIKAYSQMGAKIRETNSAQELLTQAYLDSAYKLSGGSYTEGNSADNAHTTTATSLFQTYQNRYKLDAAAQEKARQDYIDKKVESTMEMFTPLGQALMAGSGYNPSAMTGSDAAYYAYLAGYDLNGWVEQNGHWLNPEGKAWKTSGNIFDMLFGTSKWVFSRNGQDSIELSDEQLAQEIANKLQEKIDAARADVKAPEIIADVDQILDNLTFNGSTNYNLDNLLYSASINTQGKGVFKMGSHQMSQDEAQYWLDNWKDISAQFSGAMQDVGFWQEQGYRDADAYLKSLYKWLTARSQITDAAAFNKTQMTTAVMKNTSESVQSSIQNKTISSNNNDYKNMVVYANDLAQIYPELINAATTFGDESTIGTKKWLNAYDQLTQKIEHLDAMSKAETTLESLLNKTGESYQRWFEGLTLEKQELVPKINIDHYQSTLALNTELNRLQREADNKEIAVKLTAVGQAQELLSDNMTADEMMQLRDTTLSWGEDGIINFNEFLSKTYEEQLSYLNTLSLETQTSLVNGLSTNLSEFSKQANALRGAEAEHAQNTIADMQDELAIQQQISSNLVAQALRDTANFDEYYSMLQEFTEKQHYINRASLLEIHNNKMDEMLGAATTVDELDDSWSKYAAITNSISADTELYAEHLIRLAENSELAASALEKYKDAVENNPSNVRAAEADLKYALALEEMAKKYNLNAEELQNFTVELSESMNLTSQEALNMATGYMKMAEEFGISAEELINHITALNALSFDPDTMTDALRELNTTAQECGISFEELVSICTDLSEEFNLTGDSGHDAIAMATTFAKANKDLGVSTEELKIQTKELQEQYGLTAKAASDLTVRNQRMNKGVQALYDNWESWSQELKKSDKTTVNYAKAAAGAQEAIKDLLGLSDDFDFADNFLEADATLTALEQAANGSEEAITELGLAVSKSWVQSLEQVNTELNLLDKEGEIESKWTMMADYFDDVVKTTIINGIIQMQENLSSLNVGDPVQSMGEEWIAAMNNMAIATGMSVDEMQSMLSSMGVSAKVETKYVEQKVQVPEYTTTEEVTAHKIAENVTAYTKTSSTTQTNVKEMNGMVPVAAIASDGDPKTPEVIYTGAGKASPNTKKGGGPAATPKAPKFKEQRHVEKDDQIDDIDEEIKDLERALDNASGEDKVSLMQQIQDAKDRKAQLINEKLKDDINIDEYLDRDEVALATATGNLSKYGVADLQVDENHNITNYEAIWNQIRTKEKELLDAWNNDTSEVNENALNEFYDFVSQFEEAYDRFVDTREEAEDFANEIEDLKPKLHEPPDLDEVEDLKLDEYEHAFDDITTSIEAMERATERASKEADNLYGAKRAQALSRVNSSIQQEIGLLHKKIEIAKKVAKFQQDQLKMSLLTAQASLGAQLQFEFAADGSITNLSAVMEELIKKYNELVEKYKESIKAFQDTGGGIEDWEKEQLDQMEAAINQQSDFISKVSDQASRYNDTLATISESMDSIADKQDEIKSNNYEILSTKLSYALDMTNAELQRIDYQLNKVADDIYKMGEAAGILSQKVGVGQEALAAYTTHMNDLNSAYQQGYIHESDYVAGLQEVRDGMYSELGALQELDKEMMNYYGETLSAAGEEIGKYTDRMDSLNSVLDHYQSLMTLIGKETDYKAMGIILQGAADTAKNSLTVAQATAEFYAKQAAEKKLLMENAIEGSKAFELYKKEWEAAEEASREAKENMLAKTQEWAEREKAVIENNFKEFKKSLEEALTGGSTFDYLSTQMERSVSLQEEYLTATNQIYETTKMINTAQKAIDQTTNTAAKRELKSFIQKTEQLKNQNKLSKYELDLHQAQYQILQAQIALEESQNAKSTVRLRRDSDGNFGYVYTADTSKIADAEQKLADAQNAYYNKSLEGANKYVQNYTETLRNMQDELTALTDAWMQGEIQSEEEYNRRKEDIVQFYGEKLKQYSHLYQVAISADSRAVADAWSTDYASMITNTQNWQEEVDKYAELCIGSMQKWQGVVTEVQKTTGLSYDDIAGKVRSVVTESEKLVTTITDPEKGVIQAMQKQLDAVSNVTTKYAEQELALGSLISQVEAYITSIDAMIAKVGQANSITLTDPSSATVSGGGGGVSGGYGDIITNNGQNNSSTEDAETKPDPNVKPYQTGVLTWTGTWEDRVWTDSAGNTYAQTSATGQKIQKAFTEAWKAAGKEYKGDWFLGWNCLNADELHEKYGLSTGGYTGDWAGPMGKLAFLHQKEIVLNKDDTANLLAAVDMLRTILHTLDVHSMSAQLGGILSTPGFHMGDSGTLEQNVKIEASFPNVQDHNEIEEAFNNLINKASQYANRK